MPKRIVLYNDQGEHWCSRCCAHHPVEAFSANKSRVDGLADACRESLKAYRRRWYHEHLEPERERARNHAQRRRLRAGIYPRVWWNDRGERYCSRCKQYMSPGAFVTHPHSKGRREDAGLSRWCRLCEGEVHKQYYWDHRDSEIQKANAWWARQPLKKRRETWRKRARARRHTKQILVAQQMERLYDFEC